MQLLYILKQKSNLLKITVLTAKTIHNLKFPYLRYLTFVIIFHTINLISLPSFTNISGYRMQTA